MSAWPGKTLPAPSGAHSAQLFATCALDHRFQDFIPNITTQRNNLTPSVFQVHCFCYLPDVLRLPASNIPGVSDSHCSRWVVLVSDSDLLEDQPEYSGSVIYSFLESKVSHLIFVRFLFGESVFPIYWVQWMKSSDTVTYHDGTKQSLKLMTACHHGLI